MFNRDYCVQHLAALYRRLSPAAWAGVGIGLPAGPVAADGTAPLTCALCAATWDGPAFEACWWCLRALARLREWQAELVLTAPDVDPDDARHDAVMDAWAERLAVAIDARVVERTRALAAWDRTMGLRRAS